MSTIFPGIVALKMKDSPRGIHSIVAVEASANDFCVRCEYSDGLIGTADLSDLSWREPECFERVENCGDRLRWEGGLEICANDILERILKSGWPFLHLVDVRSVGEEFRLWVKFNDGFEGVTDLSQFVERRFGLCGFLAEQPKGYFENVALDPGGMLAWDELVDLHVDMVRKTFINPSDTRQVTPHDFRAHIGDYFEYPDIVSATTLPGYLVHASFSDGREGVADFSDWVDNEYYEGWKTKKFDFVKKARVKPWGIGWGRWLNDVSLSGDWIYERLQHA